MFEYSKKGDSDAPLLSGGLALRLILHIVFGLVGGVFTFFGTTLGIVFLTTTTRSNESAGAEECEQDEKLTHGNSPFLFETSIEHP